jgi:hypothetical protein
VHYSQNVDTRAGRGCLNCGAVLPEDAWFCQRCGSPVPLEAEAEGSDAVDERPEPAVFLRPWGRRVAAAGLILLAAATVSFALLVLLFDVFVES